MKKSLLTASLALLLSLSASANSLIFSESFDTADSISSWGGSPVWNETNGNPGGAVVVTNNTPPGNKNFTVDIPLELAEDSDLTVSFDALSLANFAGVFHFYVEPEGFPQFFLNYNNEVSINPTTYTQLSFTVENVPSTSSYLTLRFEMVTGAEPSAIVSVAIDNISVEGPSVDPVGTWKGYTLVDGFWAENVGQLGWINVQLDPWLWSSYLGEWIYLPEGSVPGTEGVWFYMAPSQ